MLKLKAAPTFTTDIKIHTPEGVMTIKGTFKHMPTDEFKAFVAKERADDKASRPDEMVIMDIMTGWSEVDAEFSVENVRELCRQYHAAGSIIVETFIEKLTQYRRGN